MAESENGCHHAQRSDKNNEGKRANEQKMLCRNQTPVLLVVYHYHSSNLDLLGFPM